MRVEHGALGAWGSVVKGLGIRLLGDPLMDRSSLNQAPMQAANEPMDTASNRFLTPINRENVAEKIQTVVMTELSAYYPLPQSLVNAHIGIRNNPKLSPTGKLWPNSLFIPVQAAINLLIQIIQ